MTTHSSKKTTHTTSAPANASPPANPQIQLPPPDAKVPIPPSSYDPTVVVDYRSAQPRQAELGSISDAAQEVNGFTDWTGVFGKTAAPAAHVAQAFTAAAQWYVLLVASTLWFNYVRASAAVAWQDARGLIEGLKGPFQLASNRDPELTTTYPAVTRLLAVAKTIAKKGASTKKLNAKAIAEGKPPIHGKVGKRRKQKLAAQPSAPEPAPPPPPSPQTTTEEAPAPAGLPAPPSGATNGAAHS